MEPIQSGAVANSDVGQERPLLTHDFRNHDFLALAVQIERGIYTCKIAERSSHSELCDFEYREEPILAGTVAIHVLNQEYPLLTQIASDVLPLAVQSENWIY